MSVRPLAPPTEEDSASVSTPMSGAAISVEAIRHSYGEREALKGVRFAVKPAEIFGLLGPNGSGKTTLFRILSTLMIPSGGRAVILGFDPARQPQQVRK